MKTAHRISFLGLFIFTPLFLLLKGSVSAEGGEDVTFTQQVNEGDLTLNYEETNIDFGIVTATGDVQDKNATLGGEDTNENNIEVRSGLAKYTGMSTGDWDLYGIDLEQEIPGDVAIGSYTLPMTLTLFQSPS